MTSTRWLASVVILFGLPVRAPAAEPATLPEVIAEMSKTVADAGHYREGDADITWQLAASGAAGLRVTQTRVTKRCVEQGTWTVSLRDIDVDTIEVQDAPSGDLHWVMVLTKGVRETAHHRMTRECQGVPREENAETAKRVGIVLTTRAAAERMAALWRTGVKLAGEH